MKRSLITLALTAAQLAPALAQVDVAKSSVPQGFPSVIVAISKKTMPSENTSLRRSTGFPVHCSGDM